jgi:hypothetical protein
MRRSLSGRARRVESFLAKDGAALPFRTTYCDAQCRKRRKAAPNVKFSDSVSLS